MQQRESNTLGQLIRSQISISCSLCEQTQSASLLVDGVRASVKHISPAWNRKKTHVVNVAVESTGTSDVFCSLSYYAVTLFAQQKIVAF